MNNQIYEMVDLYFGEKFVLYNDASFLLDDHQFNFFALFIRYIETLGKSIGLNVDQSQRLLQRIKQKNMQYVKDDLDFSIEISDDYTEFSDQLEIQYLSLLDIRRYSVDISGFYREDNETDPPGTIEELFDRLYDFPKDDKKIILDAIHQDENGRSYQYLLNDAMEDDESLNVHMSQTRIYHCISILIQTIQNIEKDMKNGSKMTMYIKQLISLHQNMSVIYG